MSYKETKKNLSLAFAELEDFEHINDVDDLNVDVDETLLSLDELNYRVELINDEMERIRDLVSNYNKMLNKLNEDYNNYEENKLKLVELEETQRLEIQKYNRLIKTRQKLSEAKEIINAKYQYPLLSGFKNYYEMISCKKANKFHLNMNTNLTVKEQNKQHEIITQSTGYKDLIWICLRIALIDAMYKNETPVLVMDDPFTNLDDEKVAAGRKLLEQISERYQIIYFTCSNSRI